MLFETPRGQAMLPNPDVEAVNAFLADCGFICNLESVETKLVLLPWESTGVVCAVNAEGWIMVECLRCPVVGYFYVFSEPGWPVLDRFLKSGWHLLKTIQQFPDEANFYYTVMTLPDRGPIVDGGNFRILHATWALDLEIKHGEIHAEGPFSLE